MSFIRARPAATRIAAGCVAVLLGVCAAAGAAGPRGSAKRKTAGTTKPPIYLFLIKSGFSKKAKPKEAMLRAVTAVMRNGQEMMLSLVRRISREHEPELLNAIQAAIINGTLIEEVPESAEVGTLEITYSNAKVLTVTIYMAYYEITTSAGTIRFTSVPLSEILRGLLK